MCCTQTNVPISNCTCSWFWCWHHSANQHRNIRACGLIIVPWQKKMTMRKVKSCNCNQTVRLYLGPVSTGIWSISSRYRSWPRLQPGPHRKSFKARPWSQLSPWREDACTSSGRGDAGSPIRGINPRKNELAWQDWKWNESSRIRRTESFLSLSIICSSSVAPNHKIHLQRVQSETLIWMGIITCGLM